MLRAFPVLALVALAGCGGDPPPERPARPALDGLETTPSPRPICGDPSEATIRAYVESLPDCGDGLRASYVAADLDGEPLLVVVYVDARATSATSGSRRGTAILTSRGELDVLPERAATTPEDRRALLSAAILLRHEDPAVTFDMAEVPEAARRHLEGPLGMRGERLVGFGTRAAGLDDDGWTEAFRYEASTLPSGVTSVEATRMVFTADGRARVPALAALPPLAEAPTPREVCGAPEEPAIRGRVPALPPCAPGVETAYAVAGTTEGQWLAVAWRDARDESAPAIREARVLVGDEFAERLPDLVHPSPPTESEALLALALLAAHDGPELAMDRRRELTILEGGPPLDELPRVGISHERGLVRLVAVGVEHEPAPRGRYWTVTRHEATLTTDGVLAVESRALLRHRWVRDDDEEDDGDD